jgi:hypothetical protein
MLLPPDDVSLDATEVPGADKSDALDGIGAMFSHEGRVFCDMREDGTWVVTDTLTHEQHVLCGLGPWEVEFHAVSGRGVLFDDSEAQLPIVLDTLMDKSVYTHVTTGELYMVELRDNVQKATPMRIVRTRFKEGSLDVRVGSTSATLSLPNCQFLRRNAGGCRLFFGLIDVYKILGLSQFKGVASKWIYETHTAWEDRLVEHFGGGHFVRATSSNELSISFELRCLPTPSASSIGFLHCLATWCSASHNRS